MRLVPTADVATACMPSNDAPHACVGGIDSLAVAGASADDGQHVRPQSRFRVPCGGARVEYGHLRLALRVRDSLIARPDSAESG
jgi:hypothetical protein